MLNRTKGQLKFPVRGEVLVLERVVEVVVHAEEEIIVTQTVSMYTYNITNIISSVSLTSLSTLVGKMSGWKVILGREIEK